MVAFAFDLASEVANYHMAKAFWWKRDFYIEQMLHERTLRRM